MKRKFVNVGNSWGIVFPKSILELLKVNPVKDMVEFEFEGETLKIYKIKENE